MAQHVRVMYKNVVALVAGGASGLGLCTAKRLIDKGCRVIVCDKKISPQFIQIQKECNFIEADVTSENDVDNLFNQIQSNFAKLHVLVNCAGIGVAHRIYQKKNNLPHPLEEFEQVMKVNLLGTFNTTRYAAKLMSQNILPQKNLQSPSKPEVVGDAYENNFLDSESIWHDPTLRGVIINTSSVSAFDGQISQTAYAASKGAVASMTLPLAREFAEFGIRVVAIAPELTVCGQEKQKKCLKVWIHTGVTPLWLEGLRESVSFESWIAVENVELCGEAISSPSYDQRTFSGLSSKQETITYGNKIQEKGLIESVLIQTGRAARASVREYFVDTNLALERLGQPEEFASCVLSVLENPLINGTVIRLDAGARYDWSGGYRELPLANDSDPAQPSD